METLTERPGRTLAYTVLACVLGFFAVGWLSSVDEAGGVSWRKFDPALGFGFAAAFAQLVLASVVWVQIRGASEALAFAQSEAAETVERERRERAADALATFVGLAANASVLYGTVTVQRLRDVVNHPGDEEVIEAARAAASQANVARQAAHAERFKIAVRTSLGGPDERAAEAFLALLDRQHERVNRIIGWSSSFRSQGTAPPTGSPPPDPILVYEDSRDLRQACLTLAGDLLRKNGPNTS